MPLLKSLFCFKGYDIGRRFLAISGACYLLFLALSSVLAQAPVLMVLLLLVCSPIILASAIRRIHHAGFATPLGAVPVLAFWLCVLGITYIEHGSAWLLMAIAVIVTFVFTTISNAKVRRSLDFVLGYHGPVNLSGSEKVTSRMHHQRIEPTLAGGHQNDNTPMTEIESHGNVRHSESQTSAQSNHQEFDLVDWVNQNKPIAIGAGALISLILIVIAVMPAFTEQQAKPTEEKVEKAEQAKQRLHKVEMPDNFWLMLDENDALTVAWQGDFRDDGEVWSTITGQGDQGCLEIVFNSRTKFRSIQVSSKNRGDYYADFSPVDTKALIEAIAKRDRFKLCGYEFSLKGTQAKLMVKKKYANYLVEPE